MNQKTILFLNVIIRAIILTYGMCNTHAINAVDASTNNISVIGHLAWRKKIPFLHSEPTISVQPHNRLFQIKDKALCSVDTQSGEILWRIELATLLPPQGKISSQVVIPWMLYPPVVTGNNVLVAFCCGDLSYICSINGASGNINWQFDSSNILGKQYSKGVVLSPPYVWHDRVIFRTRDGLTALKLSDGTILWNVPMDSTIPVPSISTASPTSDASIYFNADYGIAYAFDPLTGRCLWRTSTHGMEIKGAINVKSVHFTLGHCQPMLLRNYLLIADGLGYIYALDSKTGKTNWEIKPGNFTFQFITLNGAIYVATDNGLYQLNLNTGAVLRQYRTAGQLVRCIFINNKAILTTYPSGWEVINLQSWKQVYADPKFSPLVDIALDGNKLYLGGANANANMDTTELRAYVLNFSSPLKRK